MTEEKILIIDDDTYIRNACAEFLRSEGYNVSTAEDGEKGIELLKAGKFELIITDFKMPGMDGLEVLKRAKELYPQTDVIVITAHGTISNAVEAMRRGAYDYLTKNFDIVELELLVKRCFEKQRLSAQVDELKEVVNLYEAGKAISSLMGLDELLNRILKLMCDTLSADGGSIMLYNEDSKELTVNVITGEFKDEFATRVIKLSEQDKAAIISGPVKNDSRFMLVDPDTSNMSVPLQLNGKLLGMINLHRRHIDKQFKKRDEYLLSIFAAQSAVAIENIYLYKSLEHEKEELDAIFTNMADGSVSMDASFSIVHMNQIAQDLLGVNCEKNIGNNLIKLLSEFTPSLSWDLLGAVTNRVFEFELTRTKGKTLCIGVVATKIIDPNKESAGYIWMLRDITEEKREGKHKNDFLSLITHKLKTPLTTIIGYSALLTEKQKDVDDRTKSALNSIHKQSELLNELVDSLIRFTSLDSEFEGLNFEKISFRDLLNNCANKLSNQSIELGAELIIDKGVDSLPLLNVDRRKTVEVIENLLKNAVKFNNKDKKEVRINASVSEGRFITVEVTDNGNGIPSEEYQKIFKRFYQIDEYDTGQVKGMGLGLALVKRIVELHGGKVWVKSVVGQGSTFCITLPLA